MLCSWPFLVFWGHDSMAYDWDQAFWHLAAHINPECPQSLTDLMVTKYRILFFFQAAFYSYSLLFNDYLMKVWAAVSLLKIYDRRTCAPSMNTNCGWFHYNKNKTSGHFICNKLLTLLKWKNFKTAQKPFTIHPFHLLVMKSQHL